MRLLKASSASPTSAKPESLRVPALAARVCTRVPSSVPAGLTSATDTGRSTPLGSDAQPVSQSARKVTKSVPAAAKAKNSDKTTAKSNQTSPEQLSKKKLSYKEQRELEGLPAAIQILESQQKAIAQELFDGSLYANNPKRAVELTARNSKIEEDLMDALQRWETLSAA